MNYKSVLEDVRKYVDQERRKADYMGASTRGIVSSRYYAMFEAYSNVLNLINALSYRNF